MYDPDHTPKHLIVGLSGGVDSALAAQLLIDQGHRVEALFMSNWAEDDDAYCSTAQDLESAREVAEHLGITLHQADFSASYRERVFAHFLDEYWAGRTPSPDILCNREIKFGEFLRYARQLGADGIATGHYARVVHAATRSHLHLAADEQKDQTYFLATVAGAALRQVEFPLGGLQKSAVRELARQRGLPNHRRKDSTGICFVGERPMREFLSRYLEAQAGEIVDDRGRTLGHHPGLCYFTIGQRRGLGIGGVAGADEAPWFVFGKDAETRRLWVTQDVNHAALRCRRADLLPPLWIHDAPAPWPWRGQARIRHRQTLQDCELQPMNGGWRIKFDSPQWAIAAGQSVVFYGGDECLGSAVIAAALPAGAESHPV